MTSKDHIESCRASFCLVNCRLTPETGIPENTSTGSGMCNTLSHFGQDETRGYGTG
jgi:hypothetical protein